MFVRLGNAPAGWKILLPNSSSSYARCRRWDSRRSSRKTPCKKLLPAYISLTSLARSRRSTNCPYCQGFAKLTCRARWSKLAKERGMRVQSTRSVLRVCSDCAFIFMKKRFHSCRLLKLARAPRPCCALAQTTDDFPGARNVC